MGKTFARKLALNFISAGAALLLIAGSVPVRAQQPAPPTPPVPETQIPEAGWLGVSVDEVTAQKAQELKLPGAYGVLVTSVGADTPAAKAGLKGGDIITEYDGERVQGVIEFRRLVRETPPGRTVKITVRRDGRSQTLSAEIGKNETANRQDLFQNIIPRFGNPGPNAFGPNAFGPNFPFGAAPEANRMLGITGQNLAGQLGSYFGAPDGEGVLVTNVESNSAAAKAGLQAGDVITKVDGNRVRSLRELRDELRMHREVTSVSLTILRKGSEMSLNVEPQRRQSPGRAHSIPL
jgi:serine protease Do